MQQTLLYNFHINNKIKIPKFSDTKTLLQELYKDRDLWYKIKNILIKDKKWFDNYENVNKSYIAPDDVLSENIEFVFSAFNRKKYLETLGWTKAYFPNFIPEQDFIYMIQNFTDNKKIIKYFMAKLTSLKSQTKKSRSNRSSRSNTRKK